MSNPQIDAEVLAIKWRNRAEAAEARVKETSNRADKTTYELRNAQARITQLEADLAAARTTKVHALVADVVEKARRWETTWHEEERALDNAIAALDAANITIQPVRTYKREEAEALLEPLALISKDNQARELRAIVNALMGVPQVTTAHVAPQAPQGHDEAGGEGDASGYDAVDEIKRALDGATSLMQTADTPTPRVQASAIDSIIRAVRLISAKVDTLARKA